MTTCSKRKCSNCFKLIDLDTEVDGNGKPRVGDISICISCGQVCVFNEDFSLRNISGPELEDIKKNYPEEFNKIMASILYIKSKVKLN